MSAHVRFVLMAFVAVVTSTLLVGCDQWGSIGYNKGYQPEQPIPFSHEIHAGAYKVPCLYCHSTAERANHSAVPSLNICMNCHLVIPGSTEKGKEYIQTVARHYNENKPLAWVKVHMLPDHVKFNHKRHVQKFGAPMACTKCHGPVETMETVYQFSSLSMGWCIDCHRQPEHQAPVSCSTCHY